MKPAERYPVERIQQIDLALAELAREQAKTEAIQTAYQEAIGKGDQAFSDKEYNLAKLSYNEAIALLPDENYPKDQIQRIDDLIEQEKETAYNQAIAKADGFFNNEEYRDARFAYNDALKIKSNDEYATGQISIIDQRLDELQREQLAKQELERSYLEKIQLGATAFGNNQYLNAKDYYQQALGLKPEELLPAQQIARIDSVLLAIQEQEEIDRQYAQAMRDGQSNFTQNQLQEAITSYQTASELKPEELLPKQRISEIEAIIAQQEEIARLAREEEEQHQARFKSSTGSL